MASRGVVRRVGDQSTVDSRTVQQEAYLDSDGYQLMSIEKLKGFTFNFTHWGPTTFVAA